MKAFRKSGAYAGLVLIIAVFLLPFYIMFYLSLSGPADSIAQEWFPRAMLFQNFADAWSKADMGRALMNSLMISIGAIAVLILCAACGGYAAARVRSRWNRAVFHVMVLSMMVPGIINTVPLYIIMRKINGINSHWAMMLLLACQCLPFSVFLYEGFIRSMNQSVEEAAVIDGCTKFSAFWRVTFPLLKPITATVVIMQGVGILEQLRPGGVLFAESKLPYAPFGDFHVFFKPTARIITCLQPARSSVWRRWCWCLFYSRSSSSRD